MRRAFGIFGAWDFPHGTNQESQRMLDCRIYIDAGGSSIPPVHGYRPAAFVAKLVTPDWAQIFHGSAKVRDVHVLDAYGLTMALRHLSKEVEGTDLLTMEVISGHPGFWGRIGHTWVAELSRVLSSDEHPTWRDLAILAGYFSLGAPRPPQSTAEAAELSKVKAERVRLARDAVDLPSGIAGIRTGSRPA